jgi:hypothetical protein
MVVDEIRKMELRIVGKWKPMLLHIILQSQVSCKVGYFTLI